MENELIQQGITLMVAGMGTVFVFLTTLVLATTLMSKLVMKFEPTVPAGGANSGVTNEELAAAAAAVQRHRRSRN